MNGTLNGIVCGRCSHWENGHRVQVKHDSIEAVRNCRGPEAQPTLPRVEVVVTSPRFPVEDVWAKINDEADFLPQLPKMHYAIEVRDFEKNNGQPFWEFYRVDIPQRGKWAGMVFVDIQASDDYYKVRDPKRVFNIVKAIAHNPEKAASDYGHQIGRCGICRRTLTDPQSIARGIGPVCAGKAGW